MEPLCSERQFGNIESTVVRVKTETLELDSDPFNGCIIFLGNFLVFLATLAFIIVPSYEENYFYLIGSIPLCIASCICFLGYFTLQPGEAAAMVLFGTYNGTIKKSGFFWTNPLVTLTKISLKSRNLNGVPMKVNDLKGNPIEIAIVIVWCVKNTARALFDVEDYQNFVLVNSESAVRHLAMMYPYDKKNENEISLRSGHQQIITELVNELQGRLDKAGIDVQEARITHLAYAPEIANSMLRRQQAEAVIEAREKIVQGAVSIVGHAITSLRENGIVDLKEDEKARLVSNMLIVLCSESHVQPVVNTSSIS
jgi:hypothetical protein